MSSQPVQNFIEHLSLEIISLSWYHTPMEQICRCILFPRGNWGGKKMLWLLGKIKTECLRIFKTTLHWPTKIFCYFYDDWILLKGYFATLNISSILFPIKWTVHMHSYLLSQDWRKHLEFKVQHCHAPPIRSQSICSFYLCK